VTRRVLVLSLVLLLTAGCSGPRTDIDATLREFPQKVRLKAASIDEPAIAPLPPSAPQLTGGLSPLATPVTLAVAPPDNRTTTTLPAPPLPCPKAGPGVTALLAAGTGVTAPPEKGTYAFRTAGKHVVGGAQAGTVDYPKTSTRVVANPKKEAGVAGGSATFAYDVIVALGSNYTLTSYRVVPMSDVTTLPAPGLYITLIATADAAGKITSQFVPVPSMLLLPFPADQGSTFNVASTDGGRANGTTMTYSGLVGDHVRVDACGAVIDTRSVTLTGRVAGQSCGTSACGSTAGSGATSTADFIATYAIATQYGGLSVKDEIAVQGGGLGAPFNDELSGVINAVPAGGTQ
jgi:hypothetical protein